MTQSLVIPLLLTLFMICSPLIQHELATQKPKPEKIGVRVIVEGCEVVEISQNEDSNG